MSWYAERILLACQSQPTSYGPSSWGARPEAQTPLVPLSDLSRQGARVCLRMQACLLVELRSVQ